MAIKQHRGPAKYYMWLSGRVWQLTSGALFQNFITVVSPPRHHALTISLARARAHTHTHTQVILLAAVLVGMSANGNTAKYLDYLNDMVLYIFTAEAVLKIVAMGLVPWR